MPKEEMVNRFNEKFEELEIRAIRTLDAINRSKTKKEKNILYKEVKSLFFIIQNFNNLEKIEFYNWFLHPCECDNDNDNGFKIINIENIEADMQSALEVARYNLLIKNPDLPYSSILDKPINNLYFTLCYYLDSQANSLDYIKTDYEEEFFIEFLNLFIGCGDFLMIDPCKDEEVIQNQKVYSSFRELVENENLLDKKDMIIILIFAAITALFLLIGIVYQ